MINICVTLYLVITWFQGCSYAEFIELNHELNHDSQVYPSPGAIPFTLTQLPRGSNGLRANKFCACEHLGTHIDAPFHFVEDGLTLTQIRVEDFFVPGVVIDVRDKVKKNSLYALSAADVAQWVETHGPLPNNSLVMVLTGWGKRYNDTVRYFGHATDTSKFIFPGVSGKAAQALLDYRESSGIHIAGMGIDTPSLDVANPDRFPAHLAILGASKYIVEHMTNLEKLPPIVPEVTVMPMKITGGTGAPARVIARVN